ncbi:hypothetical protein Tco_1506550 [Tanacetum coccineum]
MEIIAVRHNNCYAYTLPRFATPQRLSDNQSRIDCGGVVGLRCRWEFIVLLVVGGIMWMMVVEFDWCLSVWVEVDEIGCGKGGGGGGGVLLSAFCAALCSLYALLSSVCICLLCSSVALLFWLVSPFPLFVPDCFAPFVPVVIDYFKEALDPDKDPRERSFDDYKRVFDLEIEQLANEYKLGIRKKDHILDMIWENCKNIQGKAKEWWYDYWLEEDEKLEYRDKKYDPPMVHIETFEVTIYSFDIGNSFICVTDEIKDTLSLGRENGSRFRKMI